MKVSVNNHETIINFWRKLYIAWFQVIGLKALWSFFCAHFNVTQTRNALGNRKGIVYVENSLITEFSFFFCKTLNIH